MKLIIARFIAIMLLVIPGLGATYGFLLMKDAVFHYFASFGNDNLTPNFEWLPFLLGLLLFAVGIAFIAGWIFFRDRKKNYLSPRFRGKRPSSPGPESSSKS
ncbi:DUF2627 domain-containing protein [Paenibacillus spongiae]|uniref:DUF2627 domain-containing protein n=1 Tax=Paenibacillus spongiae TaxID=2909671 RepID=A0ABY5SI63_9BACL|nr:DUF2627 domain-containing protein [Paenibacillus spongiae]UVI32313.1 DUF2627 domain-containing protein [Paenibacillus spongiae]